MMPMRKFPLTIYFDSAALRALFRGWLSDGGGEQEFSAVVSDERGTRIDVDYDRETVVIVEFQSPSKGKQ